MRTSYVQADLEHKRGGRANLLRAAARENIRDGLIITILMIALSIAATLITGRTSVVVPLVLIWGIVLIRRGLSQRRDAK